MDTAVHSRWLLPLQLCWSPSRRRSPGGSGWRRPRRGWRKTTTRCTSRSPSPCRTTRGSSTRTPSRSARPSSSASAPTEDTTAGIGATDEVASSQPLKLPRYGSLVPLHHHIRFRLCRVPDPLSICWSYGTRQHAIPTLVSTSTKLLLITLLSYKIKVFFFIVRPCFNPFMSSYSAIVP